MRHPRRIRVAGLLAAAGLGLAPAGLAFAASAAVPYRGTTSQHGAVSFTLQGARVTNFRFVNACPADSNAGTLVDASIAVHSGAFSYSDAQFTLSGRVNAASASGTARDRTGDCDSGTLRWTARRG